MTAAAESGPPVVFVDEPQTVDGATGNLAATLEECPKWGGGLSAEGGPAAGALGAGRRRGDRAAVTAALLVGSAVAAGKVVLVAGGWLAAAALGLVVVLAGAEAVMAWRRTAEIVVAVVAALLVGFAAAAPWLANQRWLGPTGDPCLIQVCDQGPAVLSPSWWSR